MRVLYTYLSLSVSLSLSLSLSIAIKYAYYMYVYIYIYYVCVRAHLCICMYVCMCRTVRAELCVQNCACTFNIAYISLYIYMIYLFIYTMPKRGNGVEIIKTCVMAFCEMWLLVQFDEARWGPNLRKHSRASSRGLRCLALCQLHGCSTWPNTLKAWKEFYLWNVIQVNSRAFGFTWLYIILHRILTSRRSAFCKFPCDLFASAGPQ